MLNETFYSRAQMCGWKEMDFWFA